MRGRIDRNGVRLLLASTSVAALLTGGGARPAFASGPCSATGIYIYPGDMVGSVDNSGAIPCIYIDGGSVTGDVTNHAGGTITPSPGSTAPSATGITIGNAASVGGAIVNNGTITTNSGAGIAINGNATVSGAIVNTGTITAGGAGIVVNGNATVSGGISNSGTLSVSGHGSGISVNVSTFSGGISNSGTISTSGNYGIFENASIFAGGIGNSGTISAGGLAGIRVSSALFGNTSAGGGIVNSGTISGNTAGIFVSGVSTFAGGITNSGTISAAQGVGLYLYGASVFAGGISNAGTITGSNGIQLGQINATPANISLSTFTGGISNSGTIIATGATAAAIGITNTSVFTGGITNSGTISGFTGILVSNSAAVSIFDSGVIVGTGGTAVNLAGNSSGNIFTLGPGYAITGNVIGTGADAFQLGGTGNGTFNLSSFGSGLQYQGFASFGLVGGVWTLTGTNPNAVPVTVNNGTLAVNGTLNASSVTVGSGGILSGTGTVDPVTTTIMNGGTLAPGTTSNPTGTLTIAGNLAFQSGAIYLVQVTPSSAASTTVTGTASLTGGTVNASFATGSYVNKTYTILTATGGLGGTTFAVLTNTNLPRYASDSLSYDAYDVYLNLKPGFTTYTGLNVNQQNVANTLTNYFNTNGGIPGQFVGLSPGGLTQLDGEAATGAERGAFQLTDEFLELMLDPFVDGRAGGGGGGGGGGAIGFAPGQQASLPPDVALAYAGVLKAPPKPTFDQRWTAWGAAYGGSNTTSGDPAVGSSDVTAQSYGYAAGMDYHVSPNTIAGFALAGAGTNWGLTNAQGGGRGDAVQVGAYSVTRFGPAYLAGALSFTNHWFTTNRSALGDKLNASFEGQSYGARIEGGYRYAVLPTLGVTPYAALQVQEFNTPSYSETDVTAGGFGLSYAAMNATDVRSELGARFDDPTLIAGMPLILRGRVAWAHDFVSNPSLSAAFESLPGAAFTVNGAPIARDSALTSAGAQLFFAANWSLLAKFDGDFAPGSQTYAGTGTLRYSW